MRISETVVSGVIRRRVLSRIRGICDALSVSSGNGRLWRSVTQCSTRCPHYIARLTRRVAQLPDALSDSVPRAPTERLLACYTHKSLSYSSTITPAHSLFFFLNDTAPPEFSPFPPPPPFPI